MKFKSSVVSADSIVIVNTLARKIAQFKYNILGERLAIGHHLLKLVNAEMNHVKTLTDSEFFVFIISTNCTTFEEAPIGVHSG